jgi:glycosidase
VGIATPNSFYGGSIRGVTRNLDYIAGLGCTAIWLSPVFENNSDAYHGYDINNYLRIDPHFGTKQDLIELVEAAHGFRKNGHPFPIRVILDVVINHSGDNWFYPGKFRYFYSNDTVFDFGDFRGDDRPVPVELRNKGWYHRRGEMGNYDSYPENQHGDMYGLKDYANDDDAIGSDVINTLIKAHCYWIREADVDGFRVDAVKHMALYDWSSKDLSDESLKTIKQVADAFNNKGFSRVMVMGHTDSSEKDEFGLSLARASEVRSALVRAGVPAAAFTFFGRGSGTPLVNAPDGVREPQNRRVEIRLQ